MHFRTESALLIDGWKIESYNTNNVAWLLQVASGEALFLEPFDLTGIKETGQKLAEIVNICIDERKDEIEDFILNSSLF